MEEYENPFRYAKLCIRDRKRLLAYYKYHHMKWGIRLMRVTRVWAIATTHAIMFTVLGVLLINIFKYG